MFRLDVFIQNDREIQRLNSQPDRTFTLSHNRFSTWTEDEAKRLLGYSGPIVFGKGDILEQISQGEELGAIDWVKKGAFGPVKDQATCMASYAFSAVDVMEAAYFIKTGHKVRLSEQQLIDCDRLNNGC